MSSVGDSDCYFRLGSGKASEEVTSVPKPEGSEGKMDNAKGEDLEVQTNVACSGNF